MFRDQPFPQSSTRGPLAMRSGFTLIELLVVISIIAILIAILLPVLSSVKYESKNFLCINRQRQWVIAATAYTVDNDGFYPDRGIDNTRAEPMWARWAARMWIDRGVDDELDDVLGSYMSEETAVWCCPLYDGAHGTGAFAGCLEHGKGHYNGGANEFRWTTYSFHGGLAERAHRGHVYNPGDRRKIGDPYIIELSDGRTYESGLLMSDVAVDDNAWVPCYYPNQTGRFPNRGAQAPWPGITTCHQPKPGVRTQFVNEFGYRINGVGGPTHTNWAYDDGSAEVRILNPGPGLLTDDQWVAVSDDAGRFMMFPD
ncbi:MAG: prepilin-type N-terminal cleavage/methylation domain-containing protein [Planctomycetota bacterium]